VSHVFSGLISVFVFDISQIPRACIQIGSGSMAPTCTALATDLHIASVLFPAANNGSRGHMMRKDRKCPSHPSLPLPHLRFNHPPSSKMTSTITIVMMMIHENVNLTVRSYSLQEGNQIQNSYLVIFGFVLVIGNQILFFYRLM
jgi:hypothetical protein